MAPSHTNHFMSSESVVPSPKSSVLIFMRARKHTQASSQARSWMYTVAARHQSTAQR
jgi:hypothetical protein